MVKAPRSKGCRVCVQRRVKCDQTKPYCLRCQRANRECPGFETTKFVDEGPTLKAMYESSSKEPSRERQPSESSTSSSSFVFEQGDNPSTIHLKKAPRQKRRSITPVSSENWISGAFERNAMISILCPNARQNQLLGDFTESMRQPIVAPTFRCHSMWLKEVALRSDPSSCLIWAVRAISISNLGRKTGNPNLIETSRRIYGKALLKLNDALQDPLEGLSSDTLSATVLLSFYEIFNCTDRSSWIKHAGGAGHLIQLRGPARHRTGVDRTVFIASRYSLIMEAFQNRHPCFLDTAEWRALGWTIHHDLKREFPDGPILDANEHFFQEIVTHPGYLCSAIDVVASARPDPAQLKTLFATGHAHRTNHQTIHARMTDELRALGQEPTKIASSYNDTTFPVVYEYRNIHIASLYCGYWAVLCAINISLIGLQAKIARSEELELATPKALQEGRLGKTILLPSEDPQTIPNPGTSASSQGRRPLWEATKSMGDSHLYITENVAYAREICKSAENMQQAPFVGPLFLVLALRMALRMGITKKEKMWVLKKLDQIGNEMGIARSEIEVYHIQRREAMDIGGDTETPRQWSQQSAGFGGRGVGTGEGGLKKGCSPGEGMMTFVEIQGLEVGVGSGIETPGMGVVIPSDPDADEEEELGLDRVGPPSLESPTWDPTLTSDPAVGATDSAGWG